MRTTWVGRVSWFTAAACAVGLLLVLASAPSAAPRGSSNAALAPAATPAAQPGPASTPAPEASPSPAPGPAEEPPPRIIRTVCTDHVCGGCDGRCRKSSGHVAVDKKGHCACTPTDGSPLDRAIRQAYEKRPPQ